MKFTFSKGIDKAEGSMRRTMASMSYPNSRAKQTRAAPQPLLAPKKTGRGRCYGGPLATVSPSLLQLSMRLNRSSGCDLRVHNRNFSLFNIKWIQLWNMLKGKQTTHKGLDTKETDASGWLWNSDFGLGSEF